MKNILKKWWWLFILILILVIGGVFLWQANDKVLSFLGINVKTATALPSDLIQTNNEELEEVILPPDPMRVVNILLLGYGGAGHDGGWLTDSMILAKINPVTKKVYLLNLPRDLWVKNPIKDDNWTKINAIYSLDKNTKKIPDLDKNGGQLAAQTVADIVGEPIDYYMAVDFSGFKKSLNILTNNKPLEIDVPYTFTDDFYPIDGKQNESCDWQDEDIATMSAELKGFELEKMFPCRYESISFKKGSMSMNADEILKYVRSRHSGTGGGDFGRSQRQQSLVAAVKKKVLSVEMLAKVPALFDQYKKMSDGDIDLELLSRAQSNWGDLMAFEIQNLVISNQNILKDGRSNDGQYILLPKSGQDNYIELREFLLVATGEMRENCGKNQTEICTTDENWAKYLEEKTISTQSLIATTAATMTN